VKRRRAPRTAAQLFARSKRFQKIWIAVTHVATDVRTDKDKPSLGKSARKFGLDPRTVLRCGGPAFRKRPNGRYAAKTSDKLLRVLVLPTEQGLTEVATRDSRQASEIANYWVALHRYINPATGDASELQTFEGKYITAANGSQIPLLTDTSVLDLLAGAGVLSFESIYRK
jgi:hypothetical protein